MVSRAVRFHYILILTVVLRESGGVVCLWIEESGIWRGQDRRERSGGGGDTVVRVYL